MPYHLATAAMLGFDPRSLGLANGRPPQIRRQKFGIEFATKFKP